MEQGKKLKYSLEINQYKIFKIKTYSQYLSV